MARDAVGQQLLVDLRGAVEAVHDHLALGGGQHRQLGDRGVLQRPVQQLDQPRRQRLDRLVVEELGAVVDRDGQPLAGVEEVERQVELRRVVVRREEVVNHEHLLAVEFFFSHRCPPK